jgi:hypothetical protein
MAQSVQFGGSTLYIPGAYFQSIVAASASSIAQNGILMIVGEANQGPDYTLESDISKNFFGPNDYGAVVSKYGSGNLVDAFKNAIQASNDPQIPGGPNLVYLLKTNPSAKAYYNLPINGFSNYGAIADTSWGANGNGINIQISATSSEVGPTTGAFAFVPNNTNGSSLLAYINGYAVGSSFSIAANALPSTLTAFEQNSTSLNYLINASSTQTMGLLATGGLDRTILSGANSGWELALTGTSSSVTITLSVGAGTGTPAWFVTPTAGDTFYIPSGSVLNPTSTQNVGWYLVTSATSTTIIATPISTGTVTPVSASVSTEVGSTPGNQLKDFSPITVQVVGGLDRGCLTGLTSFTLTTSVLSNQLTITSSVPFTTTPVVGDFVHIPHGSGIAGTSDVNTGWFKVISATSTVVVLNRLSNSSVMAASAYSITTGSSSVMAVLSPSVPGLGKSLEILDGGGTQALNTVFLTLTGGAATFISNSTTPVLETSSSENSVSMVVKRTSTGTTTTVTPNNFVCINVGYQGTTASLTIGITNSQPVLTTTVTGGVGANLTINPVTMQIGSLTSLVKYINAQPGYSASLTVPQAGQLPCVTFNTLTNTFQWTLDQNTYGILSTTGAQPGRIKNDAYAFFNAVQQNGQIVQLTAPYTVSNTTAINYPVQPAAGLPQVIPVTYLSGGTKGGTTNANVTGAIDACQNITGNFLVTCFSQNASLDIASGLTDPSSTYTISSINAYANSHVLFMSQIPQRGNRQAFTSIRDSFLNDQSAAQTIASYRTSMTFQDFIVINSQGNLTQFQPWMGAVLAAGMQAAGFYKSIERKLINCQGVIKNIPSGSTTPDFNYNNNSNVNTALINGLLPAKANTNGGFSWISDQTTYSADNNFVYNSIQAIYDADLVNLTIAQRMDALYIGSSLADVSASSALSSLQSIMADIKRLKLIASSSDAPTGYRNPVVMVSGNTMTISVEIKLASEISFILITTTITPVTQTATG